MSENILYFSSTVWQLSLSKGTIFKPDEFGTNYLKLTVASFSSEIQVCLHH